MNKFTKVLASFCAAAMIFGSFSATVFADEVAAGDQESSSEKPSDYYDAPSVREDAIAEGFESLDARVKRIEAENNDTQSGNDDTQAGVDDDYPEGYGIPGVNGSQAGTNGDQGADQPAVQGADQPVNQPVDQPVNPEIEPVPANVTIGVNQQYINNNGIQMPITSGTYKLEENITVANCAYAEIGDQDITIDLNGHTITYVGCENLYVLGKVRGSNGDGTGSLMTRATGISLTIMDSGSTGLITTGEGYSGSGNTDYWINDTGVGKDTGRGGCILVESGCFLVLNGGTISGFKAADDGGAIHVSNGGSFTMNGGKITNCSAGQGGGGIAVHAASKSKYKPDESISIRGSLVINGGEISGNTATTQGGGVRALRGDMEINGGVIENNICKSGTGSFGGGGVSVSKGNVSPVMKISGNPKIENNTCTANPKRNNMYFFDGITLSLGGALSPEAKIGFASDTNTRTMKYFNTTGNSYALTSFFCDDSDYKPVENNGYIMLTNTVPQVAGYQLVIAGDIKLRAALNLGTFAEDSTSVTYSYSYTKDTKTVNVEKTVNYSDFGTYESYRTVDIPVESACITSPITLTINYGTDGHVTKDPVTVDQYITNVMHGDFDDKIKAVAYSIRVYGSFAMMQFNINMNDPALRPASEEINASLYDPQTVILQKYLIGDGALYAPANDPDEAFYGASVSFLSKTEVNMYFKKSVLGTTAPKMTVTYSNGKEETISATENGSYYVYTVKGSSGNGFAATKFDVPFSYSVGNVSGEYSVNTYLQVVEYKFHGESSNITLKLAEAYYDFARKCQQL